MIVCSTRSCPMSAYPRDTIQVSPCAKIRPLACCVCTTTMHRYTVPVKHASMLKRSMAWIVSVYVWLVRHVCTPRGPHAEACYCVEWVYTAHLCRAALLSECACVHRGLPRNTQVSGQLAPSMLPCTECCVVRPCQAHAHAKRVVWMGLYLAPLAKANRVCLLDLGPRSGPHGPK